MTYYAHNVWMPPMALADGYGPSSMTVIMRHLAWWAGWTEVSLTNPGDAFWTTSKCIEAVAGIGTGFEVQASQPGIIYDPLGRFTAAMATNRYVVFLKGTGQNRVAAHIVAYIDANHVRLGLECLDSAGWADEQGIAARVIGGNSGGTTTFANGALASGQSVLIQAPVGNLRVRIYYQDVSNILFYAQPKGGAGTATETTGRGLISYATNWIRFNAVIDDHNLLVWGVADEGGNVTNLFVMLVGELEDVDTGDTDPGFLYGYSDLETNIPWYLEVYQLNGAGTPAAITGYPVYPKWHTDTAWSSSFVNLSATKLDCDKAPVYKFLVHLDNILTVGACFRGRIPLVRGTWTGFERFRPLDAARNYVHLVSGLIVPYGGPTKPAPIGACGA